MAIFKEKELTEAEKRFNQERAGGNYGAGTKELQVGTACCQSFSLIACVQYRRCMYFKAVKCT